MDIFIAFNAFQLISLQEGRIHTYFYQPRHSGSLYIWSGKDFMPNALPDKTLPIYLGLGPAQGRGRVVNRQPRGSYTGTKADLSKSGEQHGLKKISS